MIPRLPPLPPANTPLVLAQLALTATLLGWLLARLFP